MYLTKRVIREEHASLAAMLQSLAMMLHAGPGEDVPAYFDVLRAMLFYIAEVPERQHHPLESRILFPRVVLRAPAVAGVVEQLDRDHRAGEEEVLRLQHALLAWELLGDARRAEFETRLDSYLRFYEAHMQLEDTAILPEADRSLTPEDWAEMDAAFSRNLDPLGEVLKGDWKTTSDPLYHRLFSRIVALAPPPVGLGDGTRRHA